MLLLIGCQNKQAYFSDWYVTVAFYTAIHFYEAMLDVAKASVTVGGFTITAGDSSALCKYSYYPL
jgi:hypothetical protein